MNQEIINKRWQFTRDELKKFQFWYKKQNKKTQDKIQDIFKYYNIPYNDLNKTIKTSDKERLKRKIDDWKKLGIFKGYFKYRIELLNKYNINYRDLIEILLYGTFMEEFQSVNDEINNLFQEVSQDCYNQGRRDLEKNEKKIPHSFLDSFNKALVDGIIFGDYLEALYLTNMQEIQKQYLISLQQNKELDIYSDFMQRQLEKQRNKLICINNDKYSGGLDKYVTALGNMAYIETSEGNNAEIKFISDHCEHVTEMCSYMDGMVFNTEKRNVFKRPYGDTQKDLAVQEIDVMGLVVGINMPPITKHFHWCHSTLTYQIDKSADELREMIFKGTWFDKLLDDEKHAVIDYISSNSFKINEALRESQNLTLKQEDLKKSLDSALEFIPKYKGIVHRSVNFDKQRHLNKILSVFDNENRVGGWNQFLSSSKGIYDEDMKLQFTIKSITGRDISLKNDEGGGEILFPRNTKFKLMTIKKENDKILVDLEEIEQC